MIQPHVSPITLSLLRPDLAAGELARHWRALLWRGIFPEALRVKCEGIVVRG
jgi:hypothetical protein